MRLADGGCYPLKLSNVVIHELAGDLLQGLKILR